MERKNAGFTLIELLVVIAIIAILAAILFPLMVSAKMKSRQAACTSNMRQIGTAVDLYSQEWGDRLPLCQTFGKYWATANPAASHMTRNDNMFLPQLLDRYTKTRKMFMCPAVGATEMTTPWAGFTPRMNGDVTYLWIHMAGDATNKSGSGCTHWPDPISGRVRTDCKRVTKAAILIDIPYWGELTARHGGGINVLFVDSHVRWFKCASNKNTDFYYYGNGTPEWEHGTAEGWYY